MSIDEELRRNQVAYVALNPTKKSPFRFRSWRATLITGLKFSCGIFVVLFVVACLVLPDYIVNRRAKYVRVQIEAGTVRITEHRHEVLGAAAHIFAHKSLLQFISPRLSFQAYVQPFTANIYLDLADDISRKDLQTKVSGNRMKVGELSVQKIVLDSTRHFNQSMGGHFKITAPDDHLALVAKMFLTRPSVNSTVAATVSVLSMVWGIIPVYLPRVHWQYQISVPALDNFSSGGLRCSSVDRSEGYPGYLKLSSAVQVHNPTPFSIMIETPLSLRVDYTWQEHDHTMAFINLDSLKAVPGLNSIDGHLTVVQTSDNKEAIEEAFSQYISHKGQRDGIYITVRDAGENSSRSELIRKAVSTISLRVAFSAPKEDYIEGMSSDLLFASSLISFSPEFYHVTMNMKVKNVLPQDAFLVNMNVKAFKNDLSGHKIYDVSRELNQQDYWIPAGAKHHWVVMDLFFSETHLRMSFDDFKYAAQTSVTRHCSVGLDGRFTVRIGPGGFEQTVRYRRNKVAAMMCYHVASPPWKCGEHMQIWAEMPDNFTSMVNQTSPQRLDPPTRFV